MHGYYTKITIILYLKEKQTDLIEKFDCAIPILKIIALNINHFSKNEWQKSDIYEQKFLDTTK